LNEDGLMSDAAVGDTGRGGAGGERSAGALLRAAREKQGLHIAALAAAIKVTPRKLEALEGDRWSELPDSTFARALAQTVCRTLKIDAKPVLDLLPPAGGVGFQSGGGSLNAPFRDKPLAAEPGFGMAAVRPMVWAAGLLMLAAVALYFVPPLWWPGGKGLGSAPPAAPGAASAPDSATPAASASGLAPAPAAPPPVALTPSGTTNTSTMTGAGSVSTVMAAAPASAPAGETVFASPQQVQADGTAPAGAVQLRVTEASWMDVRDARGQVLLSRMVQPGESVGLDGTPPLRLTIGNAAATQLGYRGQAIDLARFTAGNVARLELR
jgi:cytoskeleton protein RodZ